MTPSVLRKSEGLARREDNAITAILLGLNDIEENSNVTGREEGSQGQQVTLCGVFESVYMILDSPKRKLANKINTIVAQLRSC